MAKKTRRPAVTAPQAEKNVSGPAGSSTGTAEQKRLELRMTRSERWMILLTAATVAIGVLQWRSAHDQSMTSKAAAQLDQRAWLGATKFTGSVLGDAPVSAQFILRNGGRTPATDVDVHFMMELVAGSARPQFEKHGFGHIEGGRASRGVLAPDQEVPVRSTLEGYPSRPQSRRTPEIVAALHRGEVALYAYGATTYRDVFSTEHRLAYCWQYQPETGTFTPCVEHNEIS